MFLYPNISTGGNIGYGLDKYSHQGKSTHTFTPPHRPKGFQKGENNPPIVHLQDLGELAHATQTRPRLAAGAARLPASTRKRWAELGLGFQSNQWGPPLIVSYHIIYRV